MGAKSSIEWTDSTWNPIRGCSMAKGSETGGCLNCYAARFNARGLPGLMSPTTGKPFARILPSGPRWTGDVELIESQLALPLKWRKPRKIFVNSQSDLFHEALSREAIDDVFAIMARCPQHTFQILTKRPERMLAYLSHEDVGRRIAETVEAANWEQGLDAEIDWCDCPPLDVWPLPNVWLGVSVENQPTADARIPLLLKTLAAVRFVSYEPALGPVDFRKWTERLGWVIVGGESGPGARSFDIAWARNTVEQCKAVGVPVFVKQLGAKPVDGSRYSMRPIPLALKDRKGGDWDEWPADLRVREMPK